MIESKTTQTLHKKMNLRPTRARSRERTKKDPPPMNVDDIELLDGAEYQAELEDIEVVHDESGNETDSSSFSEEDGEASSKNADDREDDDEDGESKNDEDQEDDDIDGKTDPANTQASKNVDTAKTDKAEHDNTGGRNGNDDNDDSEKDKDTANDTTEAATTATDGKPDLKRAEATKVVEPGTPSPNTPKAQKKDSNNTSQRSQNPTPTDTGCEVTVTVPAPPVAPAPKDHTDATLQPKSQTTKARKKTPTKVEPSLQRILFGIHTRLLNIETVIKDTRQAQIDTAEKIEAAVLSAAAEQLNWEDIHDNIVEIEKNTTSTLEICKQAALPAPNDNNTAGMAAVPSESSTLFAKGQKGSKSTTKKSKKKKTDDSQPKAKKKRRPHTPHVPPQRNAARPAPLVTTYPGTKQSTQMKMGHLKITSMKARDGQDNPV